MKRLVKFLVPRTVPPRFREADAGMASDRHRMKWAGGTLAILFVLLAPWGGPCERRTRPADPTTSGLSGILGPESESHPGLHGSEYGSGMPEMALDILDDEEDDGDEFGSRILLGPSRGITPRAHALHGPMAGDHHHDDSGRSTRSALLRC
jgi:hypothetical protein